MFSSNPDRSGSEPPGEDRLHSATVPPSDISHYRILGQLGRGAMGEVYRAVDQRLGREVALKMLPVEVEGNADWQTRLLREAQAASALNHPGIVTLFDIESADGRSFLVMELVSGEPFSEVARRGVHWRRALELTAAVADALAAAHALGILHRDIKSDNLMQTAKGQVKVLDFGLAKLRADVGAIATPVAGGEGAPPPPVAPLVPLWPAPAASEPRAAPHPVGDAGLAATLVPAPAPPSSQPSWPPERNALRSDLTQAGQMVGTPAYMAPECYEGSADVRSEVFALGVVLYELLVGKRPFDRDSSFATMAAIALDDPTLPSDAAPTRRIPGRVDQIVLRALAKAPAARFADMAAFATELRAAARPMAWRPWAVAVAALLAIAGGLLIWKLAASNPRAEVVISVTASRRLTMDTGCEEYPRFTPDAQAIVFDGVIEGDYEVLRMPLDGGPRHRLTRDAGWDYASGLSPDGTRVAYIHEGSAGRTVRVIGDGDDHQAALDLGPISGYPGWTRDGALLVGDGAGRVLRWELGDGGVARETVLGQLPAGARAYHFATVGALGVAVLWWTQSDGDATGIGELASDGTLRVIEETATDYEGGLAPSSSGRGYYVTRKGATTGNQLLWRRWGGGEPVVVPGGLSPRAGVDVSRDGKRLVFSTCTDRQYIARLRDGAAPAVVSRGDWQDASPVAIGATRLLITSDRLGHQQGWVVDLAGGEARAITPPRSHGAMPSYDGRTVVYAVDGGRGGLAVVAIDGGAPRRLTADGADSSPAFTGDGQQVVFERTVAGGQPRLHVVAIAGGAARALTDGGQPATSPVDGTIAFIAAADASGGRRVMLTDVGGAPPRPVPGLDLAAWQRPRFSADGKRLLLVRGFQQIVEATVDGSAAPRVLWTATTDAVLAADWAPDGDGIVAGLADYDGDIWLAEGVFP